MSHFANRLVTRVVVGSLLFFAPVHAAIAGSADEPGTTRFQADVSGLMLRASRVAPSAIADVVVLDDEETLTFDDQGGIRRSRYSLYKILTQKGAQEWGSISLGWEPWRGERPILHARVITPDNKIHALDDKTVVDSPARETQDSVFSDRRVVRAPLPAVAAGAVVEEEQTSNENPIFAGAAYVERFYLAGSIPTQHTRLILDAPSKLPIQYEIRLLPDLKPARTEFSGRVRIVFDVGPINPMEHAEPGLPGDLPAYASVTFSTGNSWQTVAEEYAKIVDQQIANSDLKVLTTKLLAGRNSREEKTAAILQYLDREVRYTGVEFGDATIVPRSPNETLTRKYGDCKDKATLLVAMLRVANIPAYLALLNVGDREDIARALPGMGMFDHAIVYAPGSPDLWIDVTDEYARLGELPIADQERFALVATTTTTSLVQVPGATSADNLLVERRDIYLAENGPARIIETSLPHGSIESSYRRSYADKGNKGAYDELSRYMKSQYLAEKLDHFDRSDPDDLSRQFELTLESDHTRRGFTDLNIAAAAIRLDALFNRLPAELRQRKQKDDSISDASTNQDVKRRSSDYQLPEAFLTEWHYTITPPVGFRPKPLPSNKKLSLGPATLSESYAADKDGVVSAVLRFDSAKRRLTASEAADLRDKVAQLMEGAPILIYFEPVGQTLLNQGKVREALQSYRDLAALHPKEAIHRLQLAEAFLAAGLGEAARSEARDAFKLEPNSALAAKTLAEILEFDSVGRQFRRGSDYTGAEAAFRTAVKLNPEDKSSIGELAVLLEHNLFGLRYGSGARLKDALAEYRKLTPEKLEELGMRNNVPFALFYDGQFAEAQSSAEELSPQPLSLIVACEAARNGSASALAEARRRIAAHAQFEQVASSAGQMLINLRMYSLGADLEEAGASGSTASDTAAYASLYRKTVPHERLQLADDPAGLALRFEILKSDPSITLDRLRSVSSRNGTTASVIPKVLKAIISGANENLTKKARNGESSDVGLDLSITRAQPAVEGNDAIGYKVTLWPSAPYKRARYIVKENGQYRLLGYWRYESIGLEVLDRIARNDLAGARVLLDWLREDWHLDGGDDPLSGDLFARMWTKGRDANAATMRLAAAAIAATDYPTAPVGIPILESSVQSATPTEKTNILLALMQSYDVLAEYDKALAVSVELASQYPESETAFASREFYLRTLGRFDEADAVAEKRLSGMPGDLPAMRQLAYTAQLRGDYVKAKAAWKRIIDSGKAEPQDLNSSAWNSLFTGQVGTSDIGNILKAVQLHNNDPAYLHTLGCLYAEVGKTKEAREVLIEAMDSLNLNEPDDNYKYAFGRIAEQYGERQLALDYYSQINKPERPIDVPDSSYELAQIRVQVLKVGKR